MAGRRAWLRPGATTSIKVTSAAMRSASEAAVAATCSLWPDPLSSPTTSCRYPLSLGRQHGPTSSSGTTPAPAAAADEVWRWASVPTQHRLAPDHVM